MIINLYVYKMVLLEVLIFWVIFRFFYKIFKGIFISVIVICDFTVIFRREFSCRLMFRSLGIIKIGLLDVKEN